MTVQSRKSRPCSALNLSSPIEAEDVGEGKGRGGKRRAPPKFGGGSRNGGASGRGEDADDRPDTTDAAVPGEVPILPTAPTPPPTGNQPRTSGIPGRIRQRFA